MKPDISTFISTLDARQAGAEMESGGSLFFGPGYWYHTLYYVELIHAGSRFGKGGNLQALLFRREDQPDHWQLNWRFRHYKDAHAWDSEDVKTWHYLRWTGPEEEMVGRVELVWKAVSDIAAQPIEKIVIKGDDKKAIECLTSKEWPWMHKQMVVSA